MVVAVRLVEVLTMVTICTMVAFIAAVVVTVERFIWISIFILKPLVFVLDILLLALEFMFVRVIDVLVAITACISATFFAEHPFQWYYDLKGEE